MKAIYLLACSCVIIAQSILLSQGETVSHETGAHETVTPPPTICQGLVLAPNVTLDKPDTNVLLTCTPTKPANGNLRWFRKGQEVTAESKGLKMVNNSLEVIKVGSDDVGEYHCFAVVDGHNCNMSVHLESAPQIKHFEPNTKNLVQGDPLVLECNMWGWPHPKISWAFNGSALNTNDSRVKISPNSHGVADAKLRLENVDYPDGGVYECVGVNESSENSTSIDVTIKSKYAALWPFLGICVEVAILCTIIFIYERRHAKKLAAEEEEEAKQEEAEHLASNNEKKEFDDVRHREVKS